MAYQCDIAEEYGTLQSGMAVRQYSTAESSVYLSSGIEYVVSFTIAENAVLQSSIEGYRGYIVNETATLQSAAINVLNFYDVLFSTPFVESGVNVDLYNLVDETALLQSVATSRTKGLISETAVLQSDAVSITHGVNVLGDVVSVSGAAQNNQTLVFGDTATLESGVTALREIDSTIGEIAALQSGLSASAYFHMDIGETASVESAVSAIFHGNTIVQETAYVYGEALLRSIGKAFSATTDTFGMGRYTNYPFVDMAVVDGVLLGVTHDGVYRLDGDTDDGVEIVCALTTGVLDFGTSELKRVPYVYVGLINDGGAVLGVQTTGLKGEPQNHEYQFDRSSEAARNARVVVGKGLCSRYWQFSLSNSGGSNLQITDVSADVALSSRRI